MFRQYFPKGIAKGEPFFNREDTLKRLLGNINAGVHTVLIAPRRYGKSSLAKHAIDKARLPHHEIDLFVAVDELDVGKKIIAGASAVIQQVSSEPEQWFNALRQFFNRANKKWTIGIRGIKLELIPNNLKTVPENIIDVFSALEFILTKKKTKAVIFIDEFQEIATTNSGKAIEGAIRHFAQESKHVVFVFSGSNCKMLKKIFADRSRPLYSLCDEIRLERIAAPYYVTYLNKVAKKTFGKKLVAEVIELILTLTERHPKYVYVLCAEVWLRCDKKLPSVHEVQKAWYEFVLQKTKDIRLELSNRSHTQIKLLIEIAKGNAANLSAKENLMRLELTSSAIVQALKVLEQLDYIEQLDSGQYRIIDPVIKSTLIYAYGK
ncbi:MAG: ATP-binding protein [Pseudomonadota bacterium]